MQTFKSQGCYLMGKLVPLSYNARNKILALKEKKIRVLFMHVVLGKGLPPWPEIRAWAGLVTAPWPLQTLEGPTWSQDSAGLLSKPCPLPAHLPDSMTISWAQRLHFYMWRGYPLLSNHSPRPLGQKQQKGSGAKRLTFKVLLVDHDVFLSLQVDGCREKGRCWIWIQKASALWWQHLH